MPLLFSCMVHHGLPLALVDLAEAQRERPRDLYPVSRSLGMQPDSAMVRQFVLQEVATWLHSGGGYTVDHILQLSLLEPRHVVDGCL